MFSFLLAQCVTGPDVTSLSSAKEVQTFLCNIILLLKNHYTNINNCWFLIDLTIKLMMILKLLLDVSTLSSVIFKSCKVTVTWQFE